jgi:hypothetical protein
MAELDNKGKRGKVNAGLGDFQKFILHVPKARFEQRHDHGNLCQTLVALAGETVVDFSLRLKKEIPGNPLWVAGYSSRSCRPSGPRRCLAGDAASRPSGLTGRGARAPVRRFRGSWQ